jgi:hypothetical protein
MHPAARLHTRMTRGENLLVMKVFCDVCVVTGRAAAGAA